MAFESPHVSPMSDIVPAGTADAMSLEPDLHLNSNRSANDADASKRPGRALGRQDVIVFCSDR